MIEGILLFSGFNSTNAYKLSMKEMENIQFGLIDMNGHCLLFN